MDAKQLLTHIVRPTLTELGLHSLAGEQLVMGTIMQESRAEFVKQIGGGPALGLGQMEPNTHNDIWLHYLKYRPQLAGMLSHLITVGGVADMVDVPPARELIGNLNYAVAMTRVHYRRVSAPLPLAGDVVAMAHYWKAHYNTAGGAGTVDEFIHNFPQTLWVDDNAA